MTTPVVLLSLTALLAAAAGPATVHAAPPPAGAAILAAAPRCAATAEAAARGIVGDLGGADTSAGFRVQDLVVDPVLHKAYVRVADCQDARKPLTLVALQASIALAPRAAVPAAAPPLQSQHDASRGDGVATPPAIPQQVAPILIARGDAVEIVVASSNVHMTLHGHATEPASAGASLDVVLEAAPGSSEPAPHLHGIAAAAHRVEVQR